MGTKFDFHQRQFASLSELIAHQHSEEQHIDGADDRCDFESWKKGLFRKSGSWKSFCTALIAKRGSRCERCGSPDDLICHHKDPRRYDDLTETKFAVLCPKCHLQIEAYCRDETSMKRCPNVDKRFLTLYPYRETDRDVLAKGSGKFMKRRLSRELDEAKTPNKWMNVAPMSERKRAEVSEALKFMRDNKELFE